MSKVRELTDEEIKETFEQLGLFDPAVLERLNALPSGSVKGTNEEEQTWIEVRSSTSILSKDTDAELG